MEREKLAAIVADMKNSQVTLEDVLRAWVGVEPAERIEKPKREKVQPVGVRRPGRKGSLRLAADALREWMAWRAAQ